jgi:hypothetical protein
LKNALLIPLILKNSKVLERNFPTKNMIFGNDFFYEKLLQVAGKTLKVVLPATRNNF